MPEFVRLQVVLNRFVVACKMVCNNINDNLYAVFICCCTKILKLILCSQVCTYREAKGLIKPVPGTFACCGLNR